MSDYLDELLPTWPEKAVAKRRENREYFKRLKKQDKKKLDQQINTLHEDVFACTDCLKCANCCTTTGPLLTNRDIERLAKYERMRPANFTETYLRLDEEGDYVFKQMPCRYLNADNTCSIYDMRPKACREYPHTDRNRQYQILNLTRKNAEVCPAVFEIVERLKSEPADKLKR